MMTATYTVLNVAVIVWLMRWLWKHTRSPIRTHLVPALSLKLLAGIVVGLIYTYYYTYLGDTFLYFQDACRITEIASTKLSQFIEVVFTGAKKVDLVNDQPRAIFFVRVLALVNLLTGSNYWLSSLWFSLFSFLGAWRLANRLCDYFPDATLIVSVSFLFFPSVLLWSSGVVKESLAFGAVCFIAAFFLRAFKKEPNRWYDYLLALMPVFLLLNLKYYWAAVLFPCLLTSFMLRQWPAAGRWKPGLLVTAWLGSFLILCGAVSLLHPNFYPENFIDVIKSNYDEFVRLSSNRLYIQYYQLEATWWSLVLNSPWALLSGLFRPFLFEVRTGLQIMSGLENLALLVLFLFQWARLKLPKGDNRLLFLSALVYCLVLCALLALSTPNFGTLSRYRIGFLPFFAFLLMMNTPSLRGKSFRKIISQLSSRQQRQA